MQKIKNAECLEAVHTHTDNLLTEKNKVNKAIQINLEKCRS